MAPYMSIDQYGRTTIRNIYFDTDNYRLIRCSLDKPNYKEKLRIRSYRRVVDNEKVFIELKKKCNSIVYKRRISLPEQAALSWISGAAHCEKDSQISREIDYFCSFYGSLFPAVFLSYEREAYYCHNGGDFRVTFDDTILCRETDISLRSDTYGTPILPEGMVLMELKCTGGIPLWMTKVLSENRIFKTSFSKYGTAYQNIIFPKLKEETHAHHTV